MGSKRIPKDVKVSARITSATKRKADKCKYSYGDLIDIGVRYVSSELNLLKLEREELLEEISEGKRNLSYNEERLGKIENHISQLSNDDGVDKYVDLPDVVDAAKVHAKIIYAGHGDRALELVNSKRIYQKSIMKEAEEKGYLPYLFLEEVLKNLAELCHTSMSDNSAGID